MSAQDRNKDPMDIARARIAEKFLPRVAFMASGSKEALPHKSTVLTRLAVTGLTHKQAYKDIFAITCIKTMAVFFVILVYYTTGIV